MEELAYASALALAVVMAVAGVAKLRHRGVTERAFRSQGLAWPGALAIAVPATEVVLALGLVVVPDWAGMATLAVLAGFTTFLVQSVRRGRALGCGCFGSTRPRPVGGVELARNGVLMAGAGFVALVAEAPNLPGLTSIVVVAVVAATSAVGLAHLGRRPWPNDPARRQGLPRGSRAPALAGGLTAPAGETTLVAFVAPSCRGCAELLAALDQMPRSEVAVRVVALDDDSSATFAAYGVRSAPYLVVVDEDGEVRSSGPATSFADIRRIMARQ